jgi:hypothetical protein
VNPTLLFQNSLPAHSPYLPDFSLSWYRSFLLWLLRRLKACHVDDFLEPFLITVEVTLSRGELGMSQPHHDIGKACALSHQSGRAGMAHRVRTDMLPVRESRQSLHVLHDGADTLIEHAAIQGHTEQVVMLRSRGANLEPCCQSILHFGAERNFLLFLPLPIVTRSQPPSISRSESLRSQTSALRSPV